VTKSVESSSLVGGIPAKVIRKVTRSAGLFPSNVCMTKGPRKPLAEGEEPEEFVEECRSCMHDLNF
jgi:hypothetical protein